MFQANAALRHISPVDPKRIALEKQLEDLTEKYAAEYIVGKDVASEPKKLDIQDAVNTIVQACQIATILESTYHPNGISDEQVNNFALVRKLALDRIVDELVPES